MLILVAPHQLSVSISPAKVASDPVYDVSYRKMPHSHAGGVVQDTGILDIITTYVVPRPADEHVLWHQLEFLQVDNIDSAAHDIYITLVNAVAFALQNIIVLPLAAQQRLTYTPERGFQIQRNDTP